MELEQVLAGIEDHLWSSEPDFGLFLVALLRMHGWRDVVEVGVFRGFTTARLLASIPSGGSFVGIDLEDHRSSARLSVEES